MKVLCEIYKSSRQEEMYLYVPKEEGLARVPEALLEKFGKNTTCHDDAVASGEKAGAGRYGQSTGGFGQSRLLPADAAAKRDLHAGN